MKEPDDPRAIFAEIASSCPAMRSRALSRTIARRFDSVLRPHGLNSSQFAVLVAVGAAGGGRAGRVAEALSLSPAAATRALDVLERNGWVRSTARTGRMRDVALTDQGQALVIAAYPDWRRLKVAVAAEIGPLPAPDPDGAA